MLTKWDNFGGVISKAKTACEVSENEIANHFVDVNKMVDIGSGVQREVARTTNWVRLGFISTNVLLRK